MAWTRYNSRYGKDCKNISSETCFSEDREVIETGCVAKVDEGRQEGIHHEEATIKQG